MSVFLLYWKQIKVIVIYFGYEIVVHFWFIFWLLLLFACMLLPCWASKVPIKYFLLNQMNIDHTPTLTCVKGFGWFVKTPGKLLTLSKSKCQSALIFIELTYSLGVDWAVGHLLTWHTSDVPEFCIYFTEPVKSHDMHSVCAPQSLSL